MPRWSPHCARWLGVEVGVNVVITTFYQCHPVFGSQRTGAGAAGGVGGQGVSQSFGEWMLLSPPLTHRLSQQGKEEWRVRRCPSYLPPFLQVILQHGALPACPRGCSRRHSHTWGAGSPACCSVAGSSPNVHEPRSYVGLQDVFLSEKRQR
jgi:hypothetical protein